MFCLGAGGISYPVQGVPPSCLGGGDTPQPDTCGNITSRHTTYALGKDCIDFLLQKYQPYRKVKKTNSRLNAEQARPQVGVVPMRLRSCHPKEWGMEPALYQDGICWNLGGESRWLHVPDHFQNHTSMFQISEEPKGSINWLHMGCTPSLASEASMTISIPNNDETFH